jgi:ParB/RepB/Spo0J family partition protein
MSTTTAVEFRMIELKQLHESPLNPRKAYPQAALDELAASIKASGIITPLIARPNAKGFEIAAGHRRYRAAKLAGLEVAPVIVRAMEDQEFVEILNIENLQRQDMTALEEADGYKLLMTKAGYTVERIADRIGMSHKYVYDRVKLLELVPEVQALLRDDKITAGHAILLARLKPGEQTRAIDVDKGGLFEREYALDDPDRGGPMLDPVKAKSVRGLDAWIAEHVRFDAAAIDTMIFPETAAVLTAAREAEEKIVKITHEYHLQESARDPKERTYSSMSWKRADGTHKSKPCEHAVIGVIVGGPGRGKAFKVCVDKDKCAQHWGAEKRERARRAKRGEVGGSQKGAANRHEREQKERDEEYKREEAERGRYKKALPKILEAIAAAVKKAPTRARGLLAEIIIDGVADSYTDAGGKKAAEYVSRGTTADDLIRHAAFISLYVDAVRPSDANRTFVRTAKAFGVDARKIVDQVAPKPEEAAAKTPAPKK